MTDHSDYIEKNEQTLNIPSDTTARYRMCKKLIGDLFFTRGGQDDLAITPEVGKMVLFPSFLKHGVQINKSNQNRISLAFNLFPFPLPSEEW